MSRYERSPQCTESPRERVAAAMQTLEQGVESIVDGEDFRRFLTVVARFHTYSFGNTFLIAMQRPDATRVAGYRKWQELGRQVKKGEQGIKILVPHKLRVQPSETEEDEKRTIVTSFGVGTVFDIAQTEGEALPEPPVAREIRESTDAGTSLFGHLERYLDAHSISVVREDTRPAKGYWEPLSRRVALDERLEGDQATKTLAHETAHFVAGHELGIPRNDAETVAESSAFVVLQHYGIDSSEYSFAYVSRWAQDKQVLKRNLDSIQKTAHAVIEGIEGCALSDDDTMPTE